MTTSNPPLKCEKCGCPLAWFGLGRIFHECPACVHPTTEPKELFCKNCGNVNKYCSCVGGRNDTPPVEGEWAEEVHALMRGAPTKQEVGQLVDYVTTLLHTEREKGRNEADWLGENLLGARESGKKQGQAEERERVVKMCEEMIQEIENKRNLNEGDYRLAAELRGKSDALSSLRDKLSTL